MTEEYLGINIDKSRDRDLPEQGYALLTRKGFYKKENETSPQQSFARAATCYSYGDLDLAQRIYDAASKHWFTFASPVLSNAVEHEYPRKLKFEEVRSYLEEKITADGLPISCYLSHIPDTKEGLVKARSEMSWLSMMGGGIGLHAGMRSPDDKSTGVMSHLKGYDADALSYKQTSSRRGSIGAYLDVDHPEIQNFMNMRNPVGGDPNKKCFNLNNAVNITDDFMEKVIQGENFQLIDPKHGETGRYLNAREVWEQLLELRKETGEPYLNFIDTVNKAKPAAVTNPAYRVKQSNLCVAPETKVLTRLGHENISDLVGEDVEVWNGFEWSEVQVNKTGVSQQLIKVVLHSGQTLECTPYHKFYVHKRGYAHPVEKRASELLVGDKIVKCNFPVIEGVTELDHPYANGFYSGDGCLTPQGKRIYLYHEKRELKEHLGNIFRDWFVQEKQNREYGHSDYLMDKFFVPLSGYTVRSRIEWFAGICDSDGTVARNGPVQGIQVCSINLEFLKEVQMMLQTLGVCSKVTQAHEGGDKLLPKNDGSGDSGYYPCKAIYRLHVAQTGVTNLQSLGFKTRRLHITDYVPTKCCLHFSKVASVVDEGRVDDTYCFNEPKRNMGVFNGILTGNCNEIHLFTDDQRTAVCCLSSLNLEKFDEWKDSGLVGDLVKFLDNVLEYFIAKAPDVLERAVYSAEKERAIGIGTLGFHSYLQSKSIPFEGGGLGSAAQVNYNLYKTIKDQAVEESKMLGSERGSPEDCEGSGMRNSHLLAIAPNASSSSLINVSPSIEVFSANAFTSQGRAGTFLIKNKHLQKVLEKYLVGEKQLGDTWKSIIDKDGSVQHLDFLSDHERKVFKTASEIDQRWVIEHASTRQPLVCQGQSVNLHVDPDIDKQTMSDLHMLAWKRELKGLYYCRTTSKVKAKVSSDNTQPLNAVKVDTSFETCLSCEG